MTTGKLVDDFENLLKNGLIKLADDKDTLTIPCDYMGVINPNYELKESGDAGLVLPDLPWMKYENELFDFDTTDVINMTTDVIFDSSCRYRIEDGMEKGMKMQRLDYFFAYLPNVEHFDLTNLNTDYVRSMEYMFLPTPLAQDLNLNQYVDSRDALDSLVKWVKGIIGEPEPDIRELLKEMFPPSKLKSVTVASNFAPGSAVGNGPISVKGMFSGCSQLTSIDMSKWNLNYAYNFEAMFALCTKLSSVTFPTGFMPASGSFNNILQKDMKLEGANFAAMFFGCPNLAMVDFTGIDMTNVKDLTFTFGMCVGLTNVAFPHTETNDFKPNALVYTFTYCLSMQTLDLTNVDASFMVAMMGAFARSSNLTTIYANENT